MAKEKLLTEELQSCEASTKMYYLNDGGGFGYGTNKR